MGREKLFERFQDLSVKVKMLGGIVQNECTKEDVEAFKKEYKGVQVELKWLKEDVIEYYEKEGKKGKNIIDTSFLYLLISKGYREFNYCGGLLSVSKGGGFDSEKLNEPFSETMYTNLVKLIYKEEEENYGEEIRNDFYRLKIVDKEEGDFRFYLTIL